MKSESLHEANFSLHKLATEIWEDNKIARFYWIKKKKKNNLKNVSTRVFKL